MAEPDEELPAENRAARRFLYAVVLGLGAAAVGFALSWSAWVAIEQTILTIHVDDLYPRAFVLVLDVAGALGFVALGLRAPSPRGRGVAASLGLGCLTAALFAAATYESGPDWTSGVAVFGAAVLIGYAVLGPEPDRPPRLLAWMVAVVIVGLSTQIAVRELVEEYRPVDLPAHRLELVAAYPYSLEVPEGASMAAVVVDARGEVGEVLRLRGRDWNVHRDDALVLPPEDVRRVRWISEGDLAIISVRIGGATREALYEREARRASQYDVLLVDGEPRALVFHLGVAPGYLWLDDDDHRALRALYEAITAP